MAVERTLVMIKPDAVSKKAIGEIINRFENEGLNILALKVRKLTTEEARLFYAVHKDKPFYDDLVKFMTSGKMVALALEGENAISRVRDIMGPTNSKEAPEGTLRAKFGTDIEKNAVHGSDSPESAKIEIPFFFSELELFA
ncbi:MAG: nucleoside-diphosphate kinase [Candidatus Schekmanbacteria bacterium]|nr:MAG: nucleoside-diphosphate kinase [Candidatus Schekmanbacteria bacterium]